MAKSQIPNQKLLHYLKEQRRAVSPSELEQALGLKHQELLQELDGLLKLGYEVEHHPYLGIRLLDIPNVLLEHEITSDLNTKILGKKIHIYQSCSSTNDKAWDRADSGIDGELFLAEEQSSGRGRIGRSWHSPQGAGIYLSFLAKLRLESANHPYITCAIALALANTIEQYSQLPVEIMWPNDIFIGDKKVAGILVESRSSHPGIYVVGIGININHTKQDFPEQLKDIATSLRIERQAGLIHRVRFLRLLLFYIDNVYVQLRKKKYERIGQAWLEFVQLVGREVRLKANSESFYGKLLELDLNKGVKLKVEKGKELSFRCEHVTSIKPIELLPKKPST